MTKHKLSSASPGLHRLERTGGEHTSPTADIAELDAEAAIAKPSVDWSGEHEGMHRHAVTSPRKQDKR